ncbi:glycogen debranching N-terminal domain-containing protein [Brachybacterium sp. AOP43-C2-M15]|uniref:glycogen debranching N-terminal domain-containing protein n=1 Tax=Brachybacterium sp. AOP43-C2-M15 TaxID=3457661 RepID=UPI004033645A
MPSPSSLTTTPAAPSTDRPLQRHQPFVHDLVGVFHAPVQAWSRTDGALHGLGAEGIYLGDTRVVSDLRCTAEGADLSPLGAQVRSAREAEFRDVVSLADGVVDPLLTLHRLRRAGAGGITEELRLVSDDDRPRRLRLRYELITDGASMSAVKDPRLLAEAGEVRPDAAPEGRVARWRIGDEGGAARLVLQDGSGAVHGTLRTTDALDPDAPVGPLVTWHLDLEVPPGGEATAAWQLVLSDPAVPFAPVDAETEAARPALPTVEAVGSTAPSAASPEHRAARELLERSLSDLDALRLQIPGDPSQAFFAAGAPWFLTLFGRDSLIAASLTLPVDARIAETTLRTLARRQGTVREVETAQQPGKILHEVRAAGMEMTDAHLPPVYYGTIDATPLWIELLHDARVAGLGDEVLHELRPSLEAAAIWLLEHADADGDGLLEYIDESGHGLVNQGWKDSGDSIRFADGSLAEGTIALAEVQGYAYAAALHAADLLAGGAPATDVGLPASLRAWAERLKERFHAAFWCEDELGPYPALALDGAKRPVDGVASNMGHLLGTGLLDAAQERIVVDRLLHPSMFSGFGIRTLSTTNGGYGPLRYHGGSVWTHDTGYILRALLRSGFPAEAEVLARGLLRAADGFELRLPELFSGEGTESVRRPVPYPASCRPQAWAAASAVPVAQALGVL